MRVLFVFLISLLLVPGLSAQDAKMPLRDMVRIPSPAPGTSDIYNYVVSVLELTLQVTEREYGRLTVYSNPQTTPQQRQLMNLANGNTDIAWSITSAERESQYLPVRVPFIGGLFGYRVLLIHADDERFNYAPTLAELKAMTAIQGANWPDTQILQFNEFNVIGSYENGLKLLHRKMVDYYPRAVHEYSQELAENPQYKLKLAPHVGLKYPNPLFFFVNKNNLELAERLTKGLTMLHNNGQLNALLYSQPFYRDADTALSGREIHVLRNPLLTKETLDALSRFQ
ncbi:amino acid ABC transporter substrate-binding protein [Aestuariibacter sp. GS-14]|uniref:transporter substrate-binding domain-containing protein n=1 Tax=Aestuariibacter sp. GS-14 TaxID=2590670 RepID=UPI00112CBCFF|nr:transporter substrate-binding domain-containing protein [Aestuariibacter sp. GS-14]TPV56519.1 amino acid ABC transporter substrate-binding protein [Aestuariibacter sp. GS-14]